MIEKPTGERMKVAAGVAGVAGAAATAVALRGVVHRRQSNGEGPPRAYRLNPKEPTAFSVRRVLRGRVDSAVERLRDPDADPVEAIHGARKDMKKLRSALRLVRPVAGERAYERENARYRDAARLLSGIRDAQARAETIGALAERFADQEPPGGWDAVSKAVVREGSPVELDRVRGEAATRIEAGRHAAQTLALPASGGALLQPGLERAYARGRRRFHEASEDPNNERLHEWRKRAKDLWYHLRLIRSAWPPALDPLVEQASELSDTLGDDHDLALLTEALDAAGERLGVEQRAHVGRLITRRRDELQRTAFDAGELLYAERPKAFARRLAAYWDAAAA
jgi:CHAD domain-containing protein